MTKRGEQARKDWQKRMRDPKFRARYENALRKWRKVSQPIIDAARESERITADDLRIIINV